MVTRLGRGTMSADGKLRIDEPRVGETTIDTMNQANTGRPRGLWMIGLYKLAKAASLIVGGLIVLRLNPIVLLDRLVRFVSQLRLDPDNRIIQSVIARISGLDQKHLDEIGAGLFLYGILFGIEGVGLLLRKRWAEYLVIVTTSLLIPLELLEVYKKASWLRIAVLLINVLIVAYLILVIRAERRGRGGRGAETAQTVPGVPPDSSQASRGP
jgi:uncharacterized membrane protein (DUF2068 family)